MESFWAAVLAAVLVGACGDPTRIADIETAMLCGGYVEADTSPYYPTDQPDVCTQVMVIAPAGALVTVESATACDIKREGVTCLTLGPNEGFRAWTPIEQGARHVEWDWVTTSCDSTC